MKTLLIVVILMGAATVAQAQKERLCCCCNVIGNSCVVHCGPCPCGGVAPNRTDLTLEVGGGGPVCANTYLSKNSPISEENLMRDVLTAQKETKHERNIPNPKKP